MNTVNCVFEGGGIKGITFIGALKALEESHIRVKNVAGTSVGALIASLVAAGYTSSELEDIIMSYDFGNLKYNSLGKYIPFFCKAVSLIKYKGLYSTDELERFVDDLLSKKGIKYFKDLKCELKIIACDVTKQKMIIFPDDAKEYGFENLEIAKAVAMSSAIPIFFQPYKVKDSLIIDGGVVSNYPIWIFNNENIQTIGFMIQEANITNTNKNLFTYITSVISTVSNKDDILIGNKLSKKNTCIIDENTVNFTDFNIDNNTKKRLIEKGYNKAKNFINSRL